MLTCIKPYIKDGVYHCETISHFANGLSVTTDIISQGLYYHLVQCPTKLDPDPKPLRDGNW